MKKMDNIEPNLFFYFFKKSGLDSDHPCGTEVACSGGCKIERWERRLRARLVS